MGDWKGSSNKKGIFGIDNIRVLSIMLLDITLHVDTYIWVPIGECRWRNIRLSPVHGVAHVEPVVQRPEVEFSKARLA